MHVAFIMSSASRAGAGVSEVARFLSQQLAERPGVEVSVLSLQDEFSLVDAHQWAPLAPQAFPTRGPSSVGYSPLLERALRSANFDIVHNHGLWQYTSASTSRWSRRTGRPYVVSPHGMLDPWAVNHSKWKKRIAMALYESRHLRDAACLHALNRSEYQAIRTFGLRNPVAVIPNGAVMPANHDPMDDTGHDHGSPKTLLFLGRIHPKKGLIQLIQAWAKLHQASRPNWELAIAGWDDGGHEQSLKAEIERLGVQSTVCLVGPKFGEEKARAFREASAFVLPSFSEGLPVAVLEAWAYGLPVVMTEFCNLPEGFAAHAAIEVRPEPESLAAGLTRLVTMDGEQRRDMGRSGLQLVRDRFTWPVVADQMLAVYRWMLGGDLPASVLLD